MITSECVCGYASGESGGLVDQLEEVFTPANDVGSDDRVHDQVAHDRAREFARVPGGGPVPGLVCFCGFGTDGQVEFDDHLLSMFITPDRIATDGQKHTPAPQVPEGIQNNRGNAYAALLLCPGCCTIDDIPQWKPTAEVVTPLVGCKRCPFMFPILPASFRQLTCDAMRNHECSGMA
jgi:hypothetical protein